MNIKSILVNFGKLPLMNLFWQLYGLSLGNPVLLTNPRSVLFICKGNICRSPFAERLAMTLVSGSSGPKPVFGSAGLDVTSPQPSPAAAANAAAKFGISLEGHTAQQLTTEMMSGYDLICTVEAAHFKELLCQYPHFSNKIILLPLLAAAEGDYRQRYYRYNIEDPYGKSAEEFQQCFQRINDCTRMLLQQIYTEERSSSRTIKNSYTPISSVQKYCCPKCHGELERDESGALLCTKCRLHYSVVENIPVFGDIDTYYGEVARKSMAALIAESHDFGIENAVLRYVKEPFVVKYILDEKRAIWTSLLPLTRDSKVLDVGCGWGTITIPLARIAGHVDAVDATIERVKFVEMRAEDNQLSNVTAAVASATALPFPDSCFDLVVFNGVLEWLGAIDTKKSPYDIQMRALQEAYRVLKPGGLVYVGIENRFSLRYFLGEPDDHSFLRFTTLMPRWLAQAYCRMRTSKDYFMHTHSLSAYRTMLQYAGFSKYKEYHPWPTYRNPVDLAELVEGSIIKQLNEHLRSEKPFSRKGMFLHLLKAVTVVEKQGALCHSFSFIYRK